MKHSKKQKQKVKIPGSFKGNSKHQQKSNKKVTHEPLVERLQAQINLLREQIQSIKEDVRPMVMEREAINESKDRLLVSCDASWKKIDGKSYAAIAFVMRSAAWKEPHKAVMPSKAQTSNESELDALYAALNSIQGLHIHSVNNAKSIKYIEIRSDSQLCINWISGKRNCYIAKIKAKLQVIRDTIKGIESLTGKEIKLTWRKRNSTHDLTLANKLVQEANGVKVH